MVENVAHGFRKPNIIDIKLGTVLYDEDALPAKKERMLIKARGTTSGEAGIRLTGFQVPYTGPIYANFGWPEHIHSWRCRSLAIEHRNPSSFRKTTEDLFAPQSSLRELHGFSPYTNR